VDFGGGTLWPAGMANPVGVHPLRWQATGETVLAKAAEADKLKQEALLASLPTTTPPRPAVRFRHSSREGALAHFASKPARAPGRLQHLAGAGVAAVVRSTGQGVPGGERCWRNRFACYRRGLPGMEGLRSWRLAE
jgi:hypothetical protein